MKKLSWLLLVLFVQEKLIILIDGSETSHIGETEHMDVLPIYASFVVTPIFKDKNRMHKRLMCAPGYDRTHK
jgi:hypothetical protein